MLTLYQFPISHYCEKIRWTLDYKEIKHEIKNLLPGLHMFKTKRMAPLTSLPILVHYDQVIQGSNTIISYLDEKFPERTLTPQEGRLKDQALAWENYLDNEIGIHVRRCCYHVLLDHPDILISFFNHNGTVWGKYFVSCLFPLMRVKMRAGMNINEQTAKTSKEKLGKAIDRLHRHLQTNDFLVGGQFTRADLTAASLLAPLFRTKKYGLLWPDTLPEQLDLLADEFHERLGWAHGLYEKFR